MAIPASPSNFVCQQANGEVYLSWGVVAGATSYSVRRSTDGGVNYTVINAPTVNNYLDTSITIGTQYWYQVASVNSDGTSSYCTAKSVVPAPTSELSLFEIRQRAQERADRVGSQFVSVSEWNFFINQSLVELYDLLITTYEDYNVADPITLTTDGSTSSFPLPNGTNNSGAQPFYKLMGVDLGLGSQPNGYVTVNKFNFIDRNRFIYPNTASTMYGVFNMRYRIVGSNINFTPTPSANQIIRLWYIPRLPMLLQDTDVTTIGISGWLQYVIVRAAKYALDKEESDTSKLDQELIFLKKRIEESAPARDEGQADTISDTRNANYWGSNNGGFNGGMGGF